MSKFTFAISFRCNDLKNQEALVDAFNSITLKSVNEGRIDLEAIKAKIHFIEKIAVIMQRELDDELKSFVRDKRFHPVKLTNEEGLCILYFNASSTAGFGGWPDYKHYLAMEKLFEFLGVTKVEFKLIKNTDADDGSEPQINAIDNVRAETKAVAEIDEKTSGSSIKGKNSIVLSSSDESPGKVSEVIYLRLPDGSSTQIHLALKAGPVSDLLTLKFENYQMIEMKLGFFTVFRPKEKSIQYKGYNIAFKCRLYLESEVTSSVYSGHMGEFYIDDREALVVEF